MMSKRFKQILITLLIFILIGLAVFAFWWIFLRNLVWTDDAYVHGNRLLIQAQVPGIAAAYFVDDNDYVEKGQLLVTLDTTQYQLRVDEELYTLAKMAQDLKNLQESTAALRFLLQEQKQGVVRANYDYNNRRALEPLLAVPTEDVEHAKIALDIAKERVEQTKATIRANEALLGVGPLEENPTLLAQRERAKSAYVDLLRCHIYAPTSGYIAKRNVQLGEWIDPQFQLMSIVPEDQMWIEANFKETKLRYVRIGQPVKITIDQYGDDVEFKGVIQGIQMGSGSAFALLPAQNATGNWIKIVQRVPTRIQLTDDLIKEYPLRIGLSAFVSVDVSDQEGPRLRPPESPQVVAATDIYPVDFDEFDEELNLIVTNRLNYPHERN